MNRKIFIFLSANHAFVGRQTPGHFLRAHRNSRHNSLPHQAQTLSEYQTADDAMDKPPQNP
jgi:hypothetical protein